MGKARASSSVASQDPGQPKTDLGSKSFFKSTAGIVTLILVGVGTGYAMYSTSNDRIKSPVEIKTDLGLPFLGMVPALGNATDGASPLLNRGVEPGFDEAVRTVRTNVLFSSTAAGAQALVITSTRSAGVRHSA